MVDGEKQKSARRAGHASNSGIVRSIAAQRTPLLTFTCPPPTALRAEILALAFCVMNMKHVSLTDYRFLVVCRLLPLLVPVVRPLSAFLAVLVAFRLLLGVPATAHFKNEPTG